MADARIEGLTSSILLAELETLKASLKIALDDPSYSAGDAKKMLLSTLLADSIISSNTNDFQAITEKSFYNSVATEARKGIVELATDAEIISETADKVLQSDDQTKIREHWAKASAVDANLGKAKVWIQDGVGEDETESFSYKFTIAFHTDKPDVTQKSYFPLPFTMPAGKRIYYIVVNGLYLSSLGSAQVDNLWLDSSIVPKEIQFGGNSFKFAIPADGTDPYILTSLSGKQSCVLDIMAIIR